MTEKNHQNSPYLISLKLKKGIIDDLILEIDPACQNSPFFKDLQQYWALDSIAIRSKSLLNDFIIKCYIRTDDTKKIKQTKIKEMKLQEKELAKQNAKKTKNQRDLGNFVISSEGENSNSNSFDENYFPKKSKQNSVLLGMDPRLEGLFQKYQCNIEGLQSQNQNASQSQSQSFFKHNELKEPKNDNIINNIIGIQDEKLKLILIYLNQENIQTFSSLELLSNRLMHIKEQYDHAHVKFIIILEEIRFLIETKGAQRQSGNNGNSSQMAGLVKQGNIIQDATFDQFEDWLCNVNLIIDMDYTITNSKAESIKYAQCCIAAAVDSKYKKMLGPFDIKGNKHTQKATSLGITNDTTLMWVDMLMSIQGVSEEKAVCIAKQYPTLKSLMDQYVKCQTADQMEHMLEAILVQVHADEEPIKRLGPALSRRIQHIFTSNNHNELVNQAKIKIKKQ